MPQRCAPPSTAPDANERPNHQPDCNSIIIESPHGLIVFDTGRHPEDTQQLLDFANRLLPRKLFAQSERACAAILQRLSRPER
jgi:hypothetical protein